MWPRGAAEPHLLEAHIVHDPLQRGVAVVIVDHRPGHRAPLRVDVFQHQAASAVKFARNGGDGSSRLRREQHTGVERSRATDQLVNAGNCRGVANELERARGGTGESGWTAASEHQWICHG